MSGDGKEYQSGQEKERDDDEDEVSERVWGEAFWGNDYFLHVTNEMLGMIKFHGLLSTVVFLLKL